MKPFIRHSSRIFRTQRLIRRIPNSISTSSAVRALSKRTYPTSSTIILSRPISTSLVLAAKNSPQALNSAVPRTAISLLGSTNAGKSVLMNLLTQSDVSLVHDTAGTTADPKICAMELHGRIGPVRLFDTPGINEKGDLGQFKRDRAMHTISQSDVAVIVVDPFTPDQSVPCAADLIREVERRQEMNRVADSGSATKEEKSQVGGRQAPTPLLIYNLREDKVKALESSGGSVALLLEDLETKIVTNLAKGAEELSLKLGKGISPPPLPPTLAVDFTCIDSSRDRVISFLERHADPRPNTVQVMPDWIVDTHQKGYSPTVFLNIPMDQQTPGMRLLRPQAMVQEALIRNFVSTYAYRMDLGMARSEDPLEQQTEKERFLKVLNPLLCSGDLNLLVTDSQAIDAVAPWTLDEKGNEIVPITTFSIIMIRYLSGGRLDYFVEGLRKLDEMVQKRATPVNEAKWKILITEACNHTRLNMDKQCADIGTVQLPNHLNATLGAENVEFEFAFGKHVIIDPTRYDLVIHCGGCMLNPQQMDSRVADLMAAGVPATNYGLLLSRIESPRTLSRVLKPWGIVYNHDEGGISTDDDDDDDSDGDEPPLATF